MMLEKPIFNKLSDKFYDLALLVLVTIMYVALCAEADMYVPAFPQMIKDFGVEENNIQLILSINFGGLCLSGLITGPLSDSFGRRKVLLAGLLLFVISSAGCVFTDNFHLMLTWRLLQGVAASVPMVIGAAAFFDKYSSEKAAQIIGILNSVISASMAAAPIIGAWIVQVFHWRVNFVIILVLAIISFVGSLLFIEETLPGDKRKPLSLTSIAADYLKLSKSMKFISYTIIVMFPFTAVLVYVANLSVIFINHMNMGLVEFSYYQASTMGTFIIFSIISIKLIAKKGIDYTKNLGGILAIIGSIIIFLISQLDHNNVNIICISMAFIAAGGAMMGGTFGTKAISVFPNMNGISMAMMTALRQLFAAGMVILSELFFDGTIKPVASIISVYAVVAVICYLIVCYKDATQFVVEEKV